MLLTNADRKHELMHRMNEAYRDLARSYGTVAAAAYMETLYSEDDLSEWRIYEHRKFLTESAS